MSTNKTGGGLEYIPASRQQTKIEEKKKIEVKKQQGYIEEPSNTAQQQQQQSMTSYYDEVNQNSERNWSKVYKLAKYNPLVPIGCLATIGVLANGIWAMRKRDTAKSQRMMRYRIAAQGATIIALVAGTMLTQLWVNLSQTQANDASPPHAASNLPPTSTSSPPPSSK